MLKLGGIKGSLDILLKDATAQEVVVRPLLGRTLEHGVGIS